MGFVICMALSLDVRRTVEAIPVRRTRLMVGGIVVALQAMNILSMLTEIFAALICPVVIQLFGFAYYGAKCMTAFMCAIRVELATATLMNGKRTARLVTRALKLFVAITFILNMGKTFFVYRSFETEAGCAVDFGGGIWPILDDICFMTLDLATFIGLLLHYRTMNSITQTAKNHTIISDAVFRILWISVIPLLSTLSITIQVLLDPSTAYFVGAMDFQVHMICMYLVYSWRRQSCELRSSLYRGGAPSKRILSACSPFVELVHKPLLVDSFLGGVASGRECSGRGSCVNQSCVCDAGWTGASDIFDTEGLDCQIHTLSLQLLWAAAALAALALWASSVPRVISRVRQCMPFLLVSLLSTSRSLKTLIPITFAFSLFNLLLTVGAASMPIVLVALGESGATDTAHDLFLSYSVANAVAYFSYCLQACFIILRVNKLLGGEAGRRDSRTETLRRAITGFERQAVAFTLLLSMFYSSFAIAPWLHNKVDYIIPVAWVLATAEWKHVTLTLAPRVQQVTLVELAPRAKGKPQNAAVGVDENRVAPAGPNDPLGSHDWGTEMDTMQDHHSQLQQQDEDEDEREGGKPSLP
ncbi:Hypothetical Protein FCC1311_102392 [Hondaea fermentalgiana]|uniref:Epidermal growth factor-like domain-containing protein n=1 Tax=Hondaea fermentalgiana TaxID=2315210 RepID=A0A2R5GT19_9STRA|nr:Hypothetical Protein FCC1311_102392 [Hondaea fermentalgiana]|eukprot:GBG34016.1 Hypothetical Protein FCC1311_102392 [Hondaea fermentalgiana]